MRSPDVHALGAVVDHGAGVDVAIEGRLAAAAESIRAVTPAIEDDRLVLEAISSLPEGVGERMMAESDDLRTCVEFVSWEVRHHCGFARQLALGEGEDVADLLKYGCGFCLRSARLVMGEAYERLHVLAGVVGDARLEEACERLRADLERDMEGEEIVAWCDDVTALLNMLVA